MRRKRAIAGAASSGPSVCRASSSRRSIEIASRLLATRSSSTAIASSYARSVEMPAPISARAIRPFENGSPSSPPSGSGLPYLRSVTASPPDGGGVERSLQTDAPAKPARPEGAVAGDGSRCDGLPGDRLLGEPDQLGVEVVDAHRHELVVREHDLHPALERRLRDDVDRGCLDLDEIDLGVDPRELLAQRLAAREVAGNERDLRAVLLAKVPLDLGMGLRRCGREVRQAPAGHKCYRARP